jgi:hypothetical protein
MKMLLALTLSLVLPILTGCAESRATKAATSDAVASPENNEPAVNLAEAPGKKPAQTKNQKGTAVADRDQIDSDKIIRRGKALPKGAALTVATCVTDADKLNGKLVKVAGTATQVCAKKGCWWMLSGDKPAQKIRITAAEYGFFVPRQIKGKKATVSGILEVKHMSKEEAQHLADDAKAAGKPLATGPLPTVELRLTAHGLEMSPAGT